MRDWQRHQHLLHQHDNAKFMKPTQRAAWPADESFGDQHPVLALTLVITVACMIGVIVVLLVTKGAL